MSILPQLERDLHEAAHRRLPEQPTARVRWPRRASLATLAGVAVALTVVVVAFSLRGQQPSSTASAPLSPPSHLGLHQLLARFAVLRRPQTVAERRFKPYPANTYIPRLTRLATTLPDGERVYLIVSRARDRYEGQPIGSYMLIPLLVGTDGSVNLLGPGAKYNQLWDYMRFPALFGTNSRQLSVWIGLVPDGVRSVRWEFPPHTIAVPVQGNVAAALLPPSTGTAITKILWYGPDERVLGRFAAPIKHVLNAQGISGATFGAPQGKVVSLLSLLLGKPHRPFDPSYICGGADVAVPWQDLTTFFRDGRFVAYSYWEQQVIPAQWPLLATARGLTIGETPAYASRLYGRAFRTSTRLGGSWYLTTPDGSLDGFTYGAPIGRGTITTIQAGPHICETVIPQGLTRQR